MEGEENKTTDKKEEFSRKTGEMGKRILEYIDKGVVLSQKGLKSAGKAISTFGDKSVQRIELVQLKKKLDKEYYSLGKFVYDKFSAFEDAELSAADSDIKTFLEKISGIADDIKKHEEQLKEEPEAGSASTENETVSEDIASDESGSSEVLSDESSLDDFALDETETDN